MALWNARRRRFEERRHLVGGIILMSLLFFGSYIPTAITLVVMIGVAWMAMISFSNFTMALCVSGGGFLIQLTFMALRHWKSIDGQVMGWVESLEIALEVSLLWSMIYGAFVWVKAILRARKAGFDEVLGAFNLYIWIATIFACLYTLVSKVNLEAFHLQAHLVKGLDVAGLKRNFTELYYFSFVTQTTLGYGDIVPVSHFARSLAVTQAMIGQFYVAGVLTYILNLWIQDLGHQVDKKIAPAHPPEKRKGDG